MRDICGVTRLSVSGYHGTVVAPQGGNICALSLLFAATTPLPDFLLLLLTGPICSRSMGGKFL
jgi:hypothetical protein